MPASMVIALAVGVLVVACLVVVRRRSATSRRTHDATSVVSAWSRHPASKPSRTVRLLRDPGEVATAVNRAAEHERETARRISARADRISRMTDRSDESS